jgi:hypothetical protein
MVILCVVTSLQQGQQKPRCNDPCVTLYTAMSVENDPDLPNRWAIQRLIPS